MSGHDDTECAVFGWTEITEPQLRVAAEQAASAAGVSFVKLTQLGPELAEIEVKHGAARGWLLLEKTDIGQVLSIDPSSDDAPNCWDTYFKALADELGGEIDFDEIDRRNALTSRPGGIGSIPYVPR